MMNRVAQWYISRRQRILKQRYLLEWREIAEEKKKHQQEEEQSVIPEGTTQGTPGLLAVCLRDT